MAEPQVYKKKLAELVPERGSFQPTSVQEAQKAIAAIEKIEAFLSTFNGQLDIEIERVEKKFRQAKKTANGTFTDSDGGFTDGDQLRERCQLPKIHQIKRVETKGRGSQNTSR